LCSGPNIGADCRSNADEISRKYLDLDQVLSIDCLGGVFKPQLVDVLSGIVKGDGQIGFATVAADLAVKARRMRSSLASHVGPTVT